MVEHHRLPLNNHLCLPNRHGQRKAQRSSESHQIYGSAGKTIFPYSWKAHLFCKCTHHPTVWGSEDTILHVLAILQVVWRTNALPWGINAFSYCFHAPLQGWRPGRASSHPHCLWGRTIIDLQSRFYGSNSRQHWMARNYTITEYILYL